MPNKPKSMTCHDLSEVLHRYGHLRAGVMLVDKDNVQHGPFTQLRVELGNGFAAVTGYEPEE